MKIEKILSKLDSQAFGLWSDSVVAEGVVLDAVADAASADAASAVAEAPAMRLLPKELERLLELSDWTVFVLQSAEPVVTCLPPLLT